jgi:diguanylate cyclase (GGDEF)-like protein
VAERIWQKVRGTSFSVQKSYYEITVSLGIACSTIEDNHIEDFLRRADEALYEAKKSGKDRIAVYNINEKQSVVASTC